MDENKTVVDIFSFKNLDAVEQVDKLTNIINSYPSLKKLQVEMNSIGRVFYDNLRRRVNVYIKRFTTTNETKRKIIEQLIQAFKNGDITIPNDTELLKELQHYCVEKTKTGYTYNGANGVNDDYVISLALCYDITLQQENNNNNQLRLV
jgi:6-pyruvoyl-tetrahydropterin synthase